MVRLFINDDVREISVRTDQEVLTEVAQHMVQGSSGTTQAWWNSPPVCTVSIGGEQVYEGNFKYNNISEAANLHVQCQAPCPLFDEEDDDDWSRFAVIIDNGSLMMKAGMAGEDYPKATFPTVLGQARGADQTAFSPDTRCGDEALSRRGNTHLRMTWPVVRGKFLVKDYQQMERLWQHTFDHELVTQLLDLSH